MIVRTIYKEKKQILTHFNILNLSKKFKFVIEAKEGHVVE